MMPVLAAVCCETVLGCQRLEGQAEADDWVVRTVLVARCCLVAAFVFAGHRLPPKISVAAGHRHIDDFEALALTLRYTAAGH